MAANLTGMFGMLNRGIQANPLTGKAGTGLLDIASAGLGGALGTAVGAEDPMAFMNEGGRQIAGGREMSKVDLEAPEGLRKAAQIQQAMGNPEQQLAYLTAARGMEEAQATKDKALLENMAQNATEEAARKRARSQKFQAIAYAKRNKDKEAVTALQTGAMAPDEYLVSQYQKKQEKKKLHNVPDGSVTLGPDGEVIFSNPKDHRPPDPTGTSGPKLIAQDKTAMTDAMEEYHKYTTRARKSTDIADAIEVNPNFKAGYLSDVDEWLNAAMGTRDGANLLRTQATELKNVGIVNAMPSGPQSDNDVRIFSAGFPAKNAGKEETVTFLRAQGRIAQRAAEFAHAKHEYIRNGRRGDFMKEWDQRMEQEARKEFIAATPASEVQYLKENPGTASMFFEEWGWLPEGY